MQMVLPPATKVELNDGNVLIIGGFLSGFNDKMIRYIGFVDEMKMCDDYAILGKDCFFFEQTDIAKNLSVGHRDQDKMVGNFSYIDYRYYNDPNNYSPLAEACREYIKEKNNSSEKQIKM